MVKMQLARSVHDILENADEAYLITKVYDDRDLSIDYTELENEKTEEKKAVKELILVRKPCFVFEIRLEASYGLLRPLWLSNSRSLEKGKGIRASFIPSSYTVFFVRTRKPLLRLDCSYFSAL